jgi:hypothetical protein
MFRARFAINVPPSPIRGSRECRVRAAPAISRAKCTKESAHEHTGSAEAIRHSPRNGLRLIRALPGDRLVDTVTGGNSASLTPASRRQDHTTSPSARRALVRSTARVHRIPLRVCDVRETPLCWNGTAVDIQVIWVFGKPEYFCRRGWTRIAEGSLSGKSGDPRGRPVVHAQPHSGSPTI